MYIIHTHSEATAKNTNNIGIVQDWYYGVGGTHIYNLDYAIRDAYKTKAAASKALKTMKECAEFETSMGWWVTTAELIEVK